MTSRTVLQRGSNGTGASSLPDDLLARAAFRLKCASLLYALGFLIVYGAYMISTPNFAARGTFAVEAIVVGSSVAAASIVFAIVATRRLRPATALDVGLIFEVVGGFGISMVEHWGFFGGGEFKIFGVSWICVWIMMFPLIAPATPGKTLLAAAITATTGPIAYTLSTAFYRADPQTADVLVRLFLPNYFCVVLAFATAKIVYGLGRKVRDARRLGAYELIDRLGQGGMGEVWLARHRLLSRPAAIKLIRPEAISADGGLHGDAIRMRFEREAEATASLHSSHSIVVYDFGVAEQGSFYYVMELLSGLDLQRLVDRFGAVSAARAAFVLDQVCHSLEDAHESGLIHRDVKPANVYLCRLGRDYDFVKVLDFGLVKRVDRTPEPHPDLTRGAFCGTPGYIAPEIILGWTHGDAQSDIYSFGCVAYWLLSGEPVFPGTTAEEIIRNQIDTKVPSLSARADVDVPESLAGIVMKCLVREPERRFKSFGEVREAIERTNLASGWSNDDARRWWETHRPLAAEPTIGRPLEPSAPRRDGF